MRPQGFLLFAIAIPNFILGSFILLRNIKDKTNVLFSMIAFSAGLWSLGLAAFIFSNDKDLALGWAQFYYCAAAVVAVSFAFFSLSYTGQLERYKSYIPIMTAPMFVVVAVLISKPELILLDLEYREWGKEVILNKPGYVAYGIYFSVYVVFGFTAILRSLLRSKGLKRLYLRYIFAGLVIAFSLGATFNLFFPFFGNYRYIWVGPLFTLAYISLVSYAIVKHKLFDIRLIIARSLGYVLSIFSISVLFGIIAINVLNEFVFKGTSLSFGQQLVYTFTAIVIAITYQPLKRFFDRATNKIFYRDAYDAQTFFDQLNRVLVTSVDIDLLLNQAVTVIDQNLKSEFSAISLRETSYLPRRFVGSKTVNFSDEELEVLKTATVQSKHRVLMADDIAETEPKLYHLMGKYNIAIIARLVTTLKYDVEGIGYLIIGDKKSGNPYSKQDASVIRIIASELVIAVQNSLRFEEISEFNVTLQEKVDTATKKLQKTNDKLLALDETKDEFISMASHQLRTPLTSVKGYLSMVIEGDAGELNEMQQKLLGQAFTSSQRMVYLIADLLNLSRLRTGKFVIEAHPTNLADVVEGEIMQLTDAAASRNLKLSFTKPKKFTSLMLDETKIRQVIMNFTDNAIYYTPSGGKIVVALRETDEVIEFTVTDNGIGVPKAEQQHLFSKFYRAGNAKKARPDGTGLGLFMAKKVIVAQGGALIFTSEDGKGSTFGFSFSKAKLAVPDVPVTPPAPQK